MGISGKINKKKTHWETFRKILRVVFLRVLSPGISRRVAEKRFKKIYRTKSFKELWEKFWEKF